MIPANQTNGQSPMPKTIQTKNSKHINADNNTWKFRTSVKCCLTDGDPAWFERNINGMRILNGTSANIHHKGVRARTNTMPGRAER